MSGIDVTDLDHIVRLGYSETAAREALKLTRGNRNAAMYLLSKDETLSSKGQQSAWRKDTPGDWVNGSGKSVPNIAENRAVHNSPIYILVEDYYPADEGDEYLYGMEITLRDGRQWKISRTYPEFYSLWVSLPIGSCMSFKNSFPPSAAFQFVFGDLSKTFLEKRKIALCEWIRELVLNEACMSNPKIVDLLYKFIDAEKNGGKQQAQAPHLRVTHAPLSSVPNTKSPLLLEKQDSMQAAASHRKAAYWAQSPLLGLEQLPLTVNKALQNMPFKVNLKKLQCYHDLIGMKLSIEEKAELDAQSKEEEAQLAAALADSAAEAVALGITDELIISADPDELTASPIHEKKPMVAVHAAVLVKEASVDAHTEESPLAAPTYCAPPQIARSLPPAAAQPVAVSTLKRLQSTTSILSLKIDNAQLRKDCSRDRLVIQGQRLDGAATPLDQVYALCQASILNAMTSADKKFDLGFHEKAASSTNPFDDQNEGEGEGASPPFSHATAVDSASPLQRDCEMFSRIALNVISRTESGSLSHSSLNEIFDLENIHQATDFTPFFFVPESVLSDPLRLTFDVLEKDSGGTTQAARGKYAQASLAQEWCVDCEGETSTVYRLMDALSMLPLLQIRVTYQVSLFGMPVYDPAHPRGSATPIVTGLTVKEGKCQILIDKITTTTSRDWNNSS